MINELYELSEAMKKCGVQEELYAQNYNDVSYKKCICATLSGGKVRELSPISSAQKTNIRNYTETSSGGFPCINLAPLYVVHDKELIQLIATVKRTPERMNSTVISRLRDGCVAQNSNWILNDESVNKKYRKSFALAERIYERLKPNPSKAFDSLFREFEHFSDPNVLHTQLTEIALKTLENGVQVAIILDMLFNCIENKRAASGNCGGFSILFNAAELFEEDIPVTSRKFTEEVNEKLLLAQRSRSCDEPNSFDAFHLPYAENYDPMPNVKIGAGFYIKTRTMNPEANCLHRYGQTGSVTFSASNETREKLQRALTYIGKAENKEKTWICIDTLEGKPRDILFAYPLSLTDIPPDFAAVFDRPKNSSISFAERAKKMLDKIKMSAGALTDSVAEDIRLFVLRRLDIKTNSGRTKVVYTRQTDPYELEKCSEEWTIGCTNLPTFAFGTPKELYPLEAADILNLSWKQNGESATDKFKPFSRYHGLEILMTPNLPVTVDLHRLSEGAMSIGAFCGNLCVKNDWDHSVWEKVKGMLALMGFFLYRNTIRKDDYMNNLPYLYGQLLKTADELHALYCRVVRGGDIPPQFAGGNLFQNAAETPVRALNMLSQRIMPYYSWAKSYRLKEVSKPGEESWRAGWLCQMCEQIMDKLQNNWTPLTRFNDEEKAQLFIGYLAAFPKKEQRQMNSEEESTHE